MNRTESRWGRPCPRARATALTGPHLVTAQVGAVTSHTGVGQDGVPITVTLAANGQRGRQESPSSAHPLVPAPTTHSLECRQTPWPLRETTSPERVLQADHQCPVRFPAGGETFLGPSTETQK